MNLEPALAGGVDWSAISTHIGTGIGAAIVAAVVTWWKGRSNERKHIAKIYSDAGEEGIEKLVERRVELAKIGEKVDELERSHTKHVLHLTRVERKVDKIDKQQDKIWEKLIELWPEPSRGT